MARCSKGTWAAFAITTVAGACLHFLYDFRPNLFTALISPVNESLWEHLKILFWPCLTAALLLCRENREALPSRLAALLLSCAAMLAVGWLYHVPLGGTALAFDVGLYVVLMAVCFFLPRFKEKPLGSGHPGIWKLLALLLGLILVLFTFFPPDSILFYDLSGAKTWLRIPC